MNAPSQTRTGQEAGVLDLFARHVAAFNSGDLEVVLQDFDDRAIVVTPDGVFEGREPIAALYGQLLAEFGVIGRGDSPGFSFDVTLVRDDMLFVVWHAESKHHVFPFGTDTFLCQDDRFLRQSIAFSPPQTKSTGPA